MLPALEHAPAAYVSSLAQTQELCTRIWPGFDEYDLDGGFFSSQRRNLQLFWCAPSQKSLSSKIEANVVITCLIPRLTIATGSLTPASIVAGAWLFACPDSVESHIPAPLFRVTLCRRLRMLIWTHDTNCTLCGQVMDHWGDHALACGCGGDRVTRHNPVRDVVHSAANDTTLRMMIVPLAPTPRIPPFLLVARPTSGSLGAPVAVRRIGFLHHQWSAPRSCFACSRRFFGESSPRLSPARRPFRTLPLSVLRQVSPFAPWSSRELAAAGLMPFGRSFLGSPVRVIVVLPSAILMSVSRSRSASRAPFTGKTRARLPNKPGRRCCSLGLSLLSESAHD